jgi:hypothetical protein
VPVPAFPLCAHFQLASGNFLRVFVLCDCGACRNRSDRPPSTPPATTKMATRNIIASVNGALLSLWPWSFLIIHGRSSGSVGTLRAPRPNLSRPICSPLCRQKSARQNGSCIEATCQVQKNAGDTPKRPEASHLKPLMVGNARRCYG